MNDFLVDRQDKDEVSCLYINGYLDAHTAPKFEESLQILVDEKRFKIVVNFLNLNYISSAGLGVFMGFGVSSIVRSPNLYMKVGRLSLVNRYPLKRTPSFFPFPSGHASDGEERMAMGTPVTRCVRSSPKGLSKPSPSPRQWLPASMNPPRQSIARRLSPASKAT